MKTYTTFLAATAMLLFQGLASAQVDKLYVFDCGWSHNTDVARWTPGVNAGKPIDMSENCFLIHDKQGYFLWDTDYPDAVAAMPDGQSSQGGATVVRRARTLAAQLQEIGVKPSDILYVGISHTHPEGDKDIFGDGAITVISTPGHTVGHQSLMVHLPKTGWVILSGDAVHLKDNWDARRVPSMQRIADLMAEHKAQLWINHDKPQSDALLRSPKFYE